MIECEHCGSHNVRLDYIEGYQGPQEMVCMMCGRKKFKEVEMASKFCEVEGCTRHSAIKGLCYTHYHEKYGKPYQPPSAMPKKPKTDTPQCMVKTIEPLPEIVITHNESICILDFTNYKDLFDAVQENAKNEMRTPAMQILWIIKTLLDKAA